ncbi:MAG: hypothetical protein A2V66_16125 [Ignavibacteria bacterium RBG_13_36_8]|nr:MAG: hypothetical protein A2V66_16125 [Ignavibacteria bacterium RBG_13_36_8]
MKLNEILKKYSDGAIDQIASDKVEESANLRLPRSVVIQEITAALSSLSYVASALAPARPPTYAFIKLLIDAPNHILPIEGFQEKVLLATKDMTDRAQTGQGLSSTKNYQLYINVLRNAWESDNEIDRSETQLLEALRKELDIWAREHLLLEHHPNIRQLWDVPGAYVSKRNYLLNTGLVLSYENNYVIADEVAIQIRRAWGIDLEKDDFERLLNYLKNEQLYFTLDKTGLQLSGTKEERIERIINALIPPTELLEFFQVEELRDFCRQTGIQISGRKSEVISNIIDFFNLELDLQKDNVEEVSPLPLEPEEREISNEVLAKLLQNLTNNQLYDVLDQSFLKTSGTKEEKINRLIESTWSEISILNRLRKNDLSELCRKLFIPISGIKSELIDRLIDGSKIRFSESTAKAFIEDQESQMEAKVSKISETSLSDSVSEEEQKQIIPKGLSDIKHDYTNLEEDEQIILALVKETKSLTEQDIERASRRYRLGWFLTKAHMADIVAKLRSQNHNPMKVRSVRSVNIYEWTGEKIKFDRKVNKSAARDVVDALRQGVVPQRNLDLIIIGQSKARSHLKELLSEAKSNKSPFKFIRGPYGAGKTFLSSWLREQALKEEFAVSTVNIGPDQPLSDLPIFYSGLINGIRIPEKTDSCALTDILESWLLLIHKRTAKIEGLTSTDASIRKKLSEIVEKRIESELAYLSDLDQGFAPALRAFYRAKNTGNQVLASTAIAWLSGSRSMSNKMLNEIGVRGFLEANQVFPRIHALLEVIKGSRYQGLLLLVDELELIRKFPHTRQREQAFEILRLLIDESGKNGLPGCLLVFTGTDTFFEDDRAGIKSYEALADRVLTPNISEGLTSIRQPVITLQGLDQSKLLAVIKKVRDLHGIAYDWDVINKFPNEALQKLVQEWTAFGEGIVTRKPRPIIREFIHMLDLCEENPNITHEELIRIDAHEKETVSQITDMLK